MDRPINSNKAPLFTALCAAMKEMAPVRKDRQAQGRPYATIGSVIEAVQDACLNNGIVIMQPLQMSADGGVYIETTICHTESGECISSQYPVASEASKAMNAAQAMGSAITYGRRYSLLSILNLAPEDDDGQSAGHPQPPQNRQAPPQNARPQAPAPAGRGQAPVAEGPPQAYVAPSPEEWGKRIKGTPQAGYRTLVIDARKAFAADAANDWMLHTLISLAPDLEVLDKLTDIATQDNFPPTFNDVADERRGELADAAPEFETWEA